MLYCALLEVMLFLVWAPTRFHNNPLDHGRKSIVSKVAFDLSEVTWRVRVDLQLDLVPVEPLFPLRDVSVRGKVSPDPGDRAKLLDDGEDIVKLRFAGLSGE